MVKCAVTVFVQDEEHDLRHVWGGRLVGHPAGHLLELLQVNALVVEVEVEDGTFKVDATGQNVVDVLKLVEGDAMLFARPFFLDLLQHFHLFAVSQARVFKKEGAELDFGDMTLEVWLVLIEKKLNHLVQEVLVKLVKFLFANFSFPVLTKEVTHQTRIVSQNCLLLIFIINIGWHAHIAKPTSSEIR